MPRHAGLLKVVLIALLMLALAGCIGAYQVAPVSPVAVGPLAPSTPDPNAGLIGMDPTVDLRPYTVLLVDRFDVSPSELKDDEDRQLAARLSPLFQTELIVRVRAAGLFERVVNLSETTFIPAEGMRPLRLEGTVTRLNVGSRALRYFVGFGAGASKVQVEMRLVDPTTGRVMLVTADRREAAFGVFGGDGEEHLREAMSDTARDFAKFLARVKAAGPSQPTADANTTSAGTAVSGVRATPPLALVGLPGTWRDLERGGVLRISGNDAALEWDLETSDMRYGAFAANAGSLYRATGRGSLTGHEVVLTGRITSGDGFSMNRTLTMTLTRDGMRLSGTMLGARNIPFSVEFERSP